MTIDMQQRPKAGANDNLDLDEQEHDGPVVKTDILIVGAGPSGASLACFLASHGLKGMIISKAPSTAVTPRAHFTNSPALECLRDIGLEAECLKNGTNLSGFDYYRWCHAMVGEEFARRNAFSQTPRRMGEYKEASPCEHTDIPQNVLEPILMRYATQNGFDVRFRTRFLALSQNETRGTTTTTTQDDVTGQHIRIESKYVFGADGARSKVVEQIGLPLKDEGEGGLALNAWFEADLSKYLDTRRGLLHEVVQPDREDDEFALISIFRMVKPWHEWLAILFPPPWAGADWRPSEEAALDRVKKFLGDDSIPIKMKGVSTWAINKTLAETYSKGNVFCLGDAVHRHPPGNGLGSNTCIQDAYNLAWKVAYVEKGKAGAVILDTYSVERQPIGQVVVKRANDVFREHFDIWASVGLVEPSHARRKEILAEFSANTPEGVARRRAFEDAIEGAIKEREGLGAEMNQSYASTGIYLRDEKAAYPTFEKDSILYHQRTTYPGARLPHVWLNKAVPSKQPISTHDLAGHGGFTLFTGIGGTEGWTKAAEAIVKELDVPVRVWTIGWRQDYGDVSHEWSKVRGIEESGCLLVRPDRTIAWRCTEVVEDSAARLRTVMRSILSLD